MGGRAAHHEYRLTRERKLPHRMIDLFGDGVRPRALVEPSKLVERQPHFPVVGVQRLHRPGPGEYYQRRVRPERTGFGYIVRELAAETLDIERIEKQIPQLIGAIAGKLRYLFLDPFD